MKKQPHQLFSLIFFIFISFFSYSQNCKYSKEEFNEEQKTEILETKKTMISGLATSNIKVGFGRKNEAYYLLFDYSRSEPKNTRTPNIEVNFPAVHYINEGYKLIFILSNDEEIILFSDDNTTTTSSETTPLFTDFSINNHRYIISKEDVEKMTTSEIKGVEFEYQKENKTSIYTHRNKLNRLKSKNLKNRALCIVNG
jgi:hypothetical protein